MARLSFAARKIADGHGLWEFSTMAATLKADEKHRVRIPDIEPGGVYQLEHPEPDVFILRRMKPVAISKPKVVRVKGELFSAGGPKLSNEDVRNMLENE